MIKFRQRTLWERILRCVSSSYRERQDAAMHEAIRRLIDDPSLPCMVGDQLIPHGYGAAKGSENRR